MKSLTKKSWLAIVIFALFGQVAWTVENMLFNSFIEETFGASKFDIALMVSLSAIVATLATLFIGAYSDKIGKRKQFMCTGYIIWGITILVFALLRKDILGSWFPAANAISLGIGLVIAFDCIMSFFGSASNDASFMAWLTDNTNDTNRGKAEGITSSMPLLSILFVFGMKIIIPPGDNHWSILFIIIGALVIIAGILGYFIVEESDIKPKKDEPYFKNIFHGFKPSVIKQNKTLYITYIAFAVFCISTQVFMPYYIIYLDKTLQLGDTYVFIMAPAIVIAAVCTIFFGRLLDKYKVKKCFAPVFVLYVVGLTILWIFNVPGTFIGAFIGCLLMMIGYLAMIAAYQATMREYTPKENVGLFQGIRMFMQVLFPMVVGPWIGAICAGGENDFTFGGVVGSDFVPSSGIFIGGVVVAIIGLIPIYFMFKNIKPRKKDLYTPFEKDLNEEKPHEDYPRPQLKRDSYFNLNGTWEYKITYKNEIPEEYDGNILVPFPLESRLSKVKKELKKGQYLYYKKEFSLPANFKKELVILHFQAVDQIATVYLNGHEVAYHENGYLPFEAQIQDYLQENNTLIVKVKDNLDPKYPFGKQTRKPKGMWYTPVTGIWQTVWIESVNKNYFESIKIDADLDNKNLHLQINTNIQNKTIKVLFNNEIIKEIETSENIVDIQFDEVKTWSPEEPNLYDLVIESKEDRIESYFAFRKIHIENGKLYLNNKPYFFNGLLDQGYYPDGIFLPATKEGFINDIRKMKELGFNTLRKHIKIEPLEFYYQCDKIGMIVFQDFVNNGKYNFLTQTAFPTIGFNKYNDNYKLSMNYPYHNHFRKYAIDTVNHLYNVPSILYWTIYNEGWSQVKSDEMYDIIKKLDPNRIIDSTSGWYHQTNSDVYSLHVYFRKVVYDKKEIPTVISEFGGYSYKIDEHAYNLDNTYGYSSYKTQEEFEEAVINLYKNEILPFINDGLSASIYTQVSDVEDETNGFYTYDRQLLKVDINKFKELFKDINK